MGALLVFSGILAATVPAVAADKVHLTVDASKPGAKIDRNIFGQFAEHLGHGVYEGVWVGPDSTIPNTRGIRNDVVAALRALKVPNVRWPGGCYADNYRWRHGIGPAGQRAARLNPDWGGVIEPNSLDAPKSVVPKSVAVKAQGGKLLLQIEPKSVTVIRMEQ